MPNSQDILQSWEANADNWIRTIDAGEIESRVIATNSAIMNCIIHYRPDRILDIGCGEGWLTRALRQKGIDAYGTDGVETLVKNAIQKDGPFYFHYTYTQIIQGTHDLPCPFDAITINFALLDKDDTDSIIQYLPNLLSETGLVFIQTLHPLSIATSGDYVSGWKEGSWQGMKQKFVLPYRWYFRTIQEWVNLFNKTGFNLLTLQEPIHPVTKSPVSIIFVLQQNNFNYKS